MGISVEWFLKAAEKGEPEAQFKMACCYANGEGVEVNPLKSLEWMEKAAKNGNQKAIKVFQDVMNSN